MPTRFFAFLCFTLYARSALAGGVPVELDPIEVNGEQALEATPRSATEGYVTADQLAQRPILRAGELLEFVPGLIVTQHSGEGKANQYFLRGFNLDHGTDFYTEVDGLPVNMRTHAHGQGYADINFIVPELIESLDYRKGPYFADVGDFAAAGSANLRYVDSLPQGMAQITVGQYGDISAFAADSPKLGPGNLLLGGQATRYDGPYELSESVRKYSGLARYNVGTSREGYTLSLMGYGISYNAPDQIPLRAVQQGSIGRYGSVDPTDGGNTRRFSVNCEWRGVADRGDWIVQGYALRYQLDLFSDFTYFLSDPTYTGTLPIDQFEQFDSRVVYGLSAKRYWTLPTPLPADLTIGVQSRYDEIGTVGLYTTQQRQRTAAVREDSVHEGSAALYASSTQRWMSWLRSEIGLRSDFYRFGVRDRIGATPYATTRDSIVSPKLALIFGPFRRTEFFVNYGEGFHSNDARAATAPAQPVTPLVKARGSEVGVNSFAISDVKLTASLWQLNFGSELVYSGDSGTSNPSAASRRYGVEFAAYWQALHWLVVDADAAYAHARLRDDPAGDRIPNSIESVYSFGIIIPVANDFSAGLRLRRLGSGPLIEDNSARSKPTTVVNAQASYHFLDSCTATLAALNVFDSRSNDITYFYTSRLQGEPAAGIADYHFHPVERRAFRLTLGTEF